MSVVIGLQVRQVPSTQLLLAGLSLGHGLHAQDMERARLPLGCNFMAS